jgi:hypothetical protein
MPRTQVNFRLGDEQKQRWRDHVEESRYDDTLSDLVKRAVENQIDQDNGDVNEGSAPEQSVAGGEVLDQIQNLRNDIEDLQTDVSQAVDAVHAQEGLDPDLQPMVLDNLPESESEALSASELAHILHEHPSTIRFALENIQRNTGIVKSKRPTEVVETEEGTAASQDDPIWWRTE